MRVRLLLLAPAVLLAAFAPATLAMPPGADAAPIQLGCRAAEATPSCYASAKSAGRGDLVLYATVAGVGLAVVVMMIAFSALARKARPSSPSSDFEQRFTWNWLTPVPARVRELMRETSRRHDYPHDLVDSWLAECVAPLARRIERIRL